MSFVSVAPELVAAAASEVTAVGSAVAAASAAAAGSTTVVAAAADEVSAAIAALFGAYAQQYQAVSAQVAGFGERFVQTLIAGAGAYIGTEVGSAAAMSPLQTVERGLWEVVNTPTEALFGRALIGNGTNGAPGTGQAGGAGGLLWGSG
ncbi:PE family protein, partial [Mycobacterium basiliense]